MFTAISQVDAAVDGIKQKAGNCNAGAALSKCHTDLFAGSAQGTSRALLVIMSGRSSDGVSSAAASLKLSGVKITVVGIGGLVVHSQLTDMAYPSSSVLRAASCKDLPSITGGVASVISDCIGNRVARFYK